MTKIQQFIEQNYSKEVEKIDISQKSPEIIAKLLEVNAKGKKIDLGAYSHLKFLKINGEFLGSFIEEVIVTSPELTTLIIDNCSHVNNLDITGCSQLKFLKLNDYHPNNLPFIFRYSDIKIKGWEDTQIWDGSDHVRTRLRNLIEERAREKETEQDDSDEFAFSSSAESEEEENDDNAVIVEREANTTVIEVPTTNKCNVL